MINPTEENFLIIGAGPTGLAMARQLKLSGRAYDHVEADHRLGGNWAHGVHDRIQLVTSRKITGFPEFPMGRRYPRFPSGAQMLQYLEDYAAHFDLVNSIQFSTKVVYAGPAEDFRWAVCFDDGRQAIYKGLFVCNGHHWARRWPDIPSQFDGEYIHSKDYKTVAQVAGKRVLVIGGGNSACDIATAAAEHGLCADMSLRRGYWFMPKNLFGIPAVEYITPWLSIKTQRAVLRRLLRLYWGPYERYGLEHPDHDVFERHPTINSIVLPLMRKSKITPRRDVLRFEGKTVHFADGASAEYDLVVCATGFEVSVPFLAPGIFRARGPVAQTYGGAVPEGYRHLYIMATAQVRSGVGAVISPYVEHVRMLMEIQESITPPLGTVLRAMGDRPPSTHLLDPHLAIAKMKAARQTLPDLVRKHAAQLETQEISEWHKPQSMPDCVDNDVVIC